MSVPRDPACATGTGLCSQEHSAVPWMSELTHCGGRIKEVPKLPVHSSLLGSMTRLPAPHSSAPQPQHSKTCTEEGREQRCDQGSMGFLHSFLFQGTITLFVTSVPSSQCTVSHLELRPTAEDPDTQKENPFGETPYKEPFHELACLNS